MTNLLLEYVWLDGYETANLRSKVKVLPFEKNGAPEVSDCPQWNFDGSSTKQAPGHASECMLQPVRVYPFKENHYLVLCEVMKEDGTPVDGNNRANLRQHQAAFEQGGYWWGFEQEYFITKD